MEFNTFLTQARSIILDPDYYRPAYALFALGTIGVSIYASIDFWDGCRELQCLQVFWYWIGISFSILGLIPVLSYIPAISGSSLGGHWIFRTSTHVVGLVMMGIAWFFILVDP